MCNAQNNVMLSVAETSMWFDLFNWFNYLKDEERKFYLTIYTIKIKIFMKKFWRK